MSLVLRSSWNSNGTQLMIHFAIHTQSAMTRSNNTLFYATPRPVLILQDKLRRTLQLSWVPNFAHVSTPFSSLNPGRDLFDGTGQALSSLRPSITIKAISLQSSFADIIKRHPSSAVWTPLSLRQLLTRPVLRGFAWKPTRRQSL